MAGMARREPAGVVAIGESRSTRRLRDCVRDLNHLYRATAQFYGSDCDRDGFRWVDLHNADESVWAFARLGVGEDAGAPITCVFNATPVPRDGYRVGVADPGYYRKIFDSDAARFGGSGYNRQIEVERVATKARKAIRIRCG